MRISENVVKPGCFTPHTPSAMGGGADVAGVHERERRPHLGVPDHPAKNSLLFRNKSETRVSRGDNSSDIQGYESLLVSIIRV